MAKNLRKIFTALAAPLALSSCNMSFPPVDNNDGDSPAAPSEQRPALTAAQVIAVSNGLLTEEQAQSRLHHFNLRAQRGLQNYIVTRLQAARYYNHCTQVDWRPEQAPADSTLLMPHIQALKASRGFITQSILRHYQEADIFICRDPEMPDTSLGAYNNDNEGIVSLNAGMSGEYNIFRTILHEGFHSLQADHLPGGFVPANLSLVDMQKSQIIVEASAAAMETIALFELYQTDGHPAWLQKSAALRSAVRNSYEINIQQGKIHSQALEAAGKAAFDVVLADQNWRDSYNRLLARNFIYFFQSHQLRDYADTAYTLESARHAGRLDDHFNITGALATLPTTQELIGDNIETAYVLQFLQLEQAGAVYGRDHALYLAFLANAENENNPYLGVDLMQVDIDGDIPMQLNCLSGRIPCLDQNNHPFQADRYKISMRRASSASWP